MAGLLPQPPLQTYNDTHDMLHDSNIGNMYQRRFQYKNNIYKTSNLHHDHVLALMGLPNDFLLTEVKGLIKVVKPGTQG